MYLHLKPITGTRTDECKGPDVHTHIHTWEQFTLNIPPTGPFWHVGCVVGGKQHGQPVQS